MGTLVNLKKQIIEFNKLCKEHKINKRTKNTLEQLITNYNLIPCETCYQTSDFNNCEYSDYIKYDVLPNINKNVDILVAMHEGNEHLIFFSNNIHSHKDIIYNFSIVIMLLKTFGNNLNTMDLLFSALAVAELDDMFYNSFSIIKIDQFLERWQ